MVPFFKSLSIAKIVPLGKFILIKCGLVRFISIKVFGLAPTYVRQCENFHYGCNYPIPASKVIHLRCWAVYINRIGAIGRSRDGEGRVGATCNVVELYFELFI